MLLQRPAIRWAQIFVLGILSKSSKCEFFPRHCSSLAKEQQATEISARNLIRIGNRESCSDYPPIWTHFIALPVPINKQTNYMIG